MGLRSALTPYVSPFFKLSEPTPVDCTSRRRVLESLRRVETATRERLEAAEVTVCVAEWVAGGRSREGRTRRADVAIFARAKLRCEGWPKIWKLAHFAHADALACESRRSRGLRRLTVEEICADVKLPPHRPPPRRRTRRDRQASQLVQVRARLEGALAELAEIEGQQRPAPASSPS
jgi:hypothetical protein